MDKKQDTGAANDFFALGVDKDMFDEALSGKEVQITLPLDDDNYTEIVENVDGALLLNCEPPDSFHGIYYWNNGRFPYIIKTGLKYVVLVNDDQAVRMNIECVKTTVGRRFRFDRKLKHSVADPNGDSCIWEVTFTLSQSAEEVHIDKPRTFLLRWNPRISSFTLNDYRSLIRRFPDGFHLNWSIYQWEDARDGDRFYMMRVGDEHAGMQFRGWFTSDPYAGEDWAGKGKPRYYADMDCVDCSAADSPRIPLEELMQAIPEVEWDHGHSGVLLTDEQAEKLNSLWEAHSVGSDGARG